VLAFKVDNPLLSCSLNSDHTVVKVSECLHLICDNRMHSLPALGQVYKLLIGLSVAVDVLLISYTRKMNVKTTTTCKRNQAFNIK